MNLLGANLHLLRIEVPLGAVRRRGKGSRELGCRTPGQSPGGSELPPEAVPGAACGGGGGGQSSRVSFCCALRHTHKKEKAYTSSAQKRGYAVTVVNIYASITKAEHRRHHPGGQGHPPCARGSVLCKCCFQPHSPVSVGR